MNMYTSSVLFVIAVALLNKDAVTDDENDVTYVQTIKDDLAPDQGNVHYLIV